MGGGLFIEFEIEEMGEEGVVEGSMGVGDGDGEVSGEGFEAVVGEVWAFTAGEREDVAGGVGGGQLVVAGAGSTKEGEIESDIIADEGVFAKEGEEVGEGLFGWLPFAGEGGVVEAGEGGDGGWEG